MRFGACGSLSEARHILDAGFDFVELPASTLDFEPWNSASFSGLPIHAANRFFPPGFKLFGPEATPFSPYARRVIERAASIGVRVIVIGGGAARSSSAPSAEADFLEVAASLQGFAEPYGVQIAPESLSRHETNVGTHLGALATALNERGLAFTADSHQILAEWDADGRTESLQVLMKRQIPFAPAHVHLANLPRTGVFADDPALKAFADRLVETGFRAAVSLECLRGDRFDFRAALREMRAIFPP